MKENDIDNFDIFFVDAINYKDRNPGDKSVDFSEPKPISEILAKDLMVDVRSLICSINDMYEYEYEDYLSLDKLWKIAVDICNAYNIKMIYMYNNCKYVVDNTSDKYIMGKAWHIPVDGYYNEIVSIAIKKLRLKQFGPDIPYLSHQYCSFVMKTNQFDNEIANLKENIELLEKDKANHELNMYMKLAQNRVNEICNAPEFDYLSFAEYTVAKQMQALVYGCFDYFGVSDIVTHTNSYKYSSDEWNEIMDKAKSIIVYTVPKSIYTEQIHKVINCFEKYISRVYPDSIGLYECFNEFKLAKWKFNRIK